MICYDFFMNVENWIKNNCSDLKNKKIVLSGATGGIGNNLAFILAQLNADIIMLGRNINKCNELKNKIISCYPNINIDIIKVDMSDIESVKACITQLNNYKKIDAIIQNAGVYNVPIYKTNFGYNNIFSINFLAPYYMTKKLIPLLEKSDLAKVVIVGSIAHNYSKLDEKDIDFSTRRKPSNIYGNSKRFLMFSMQELFKDNKKISLSVVHPGITFTNMTNHYPKFIYVIIKYPMKIIFMSTKKACLSIIKGIFDSTNYHQWIGPKLANIWGKPKKQNLKTCTMKESKRIYEISEKIFDSLK